MRGIDRAGNDTSASAAGMPIRTAAPRARVDRNAARAASVRPVASIAQSTPPPDTAHTRSAVSSGPPDHSTAWVAPSDRAASSLSDATSTATIGCAPAATAPSTALRPTPPQPKTATRSPGRTPAVRHTAPVPVVIAQPTSAATSKGTSSGIGMQQRAGTTARSANVERKQ